MPTKSEVAWPGLAFASAACGEVAPNTVGMSMLVFSSSMFAVATPPTLQPARVNGTQGAGAFSPCAVSMLKVVSFPAAGVGSKSGAVQYANDTPTLLAPPPPGTK